MFKNLVLDDLNFMTLCIILLEVVIRHGCTVVRKLWTLSNQIKPYLSGTERGPKCVKKIFAILHLPEAAGIFSQSVIVQLWCACMKCSLSFLFSANRRSFRWSSAAVAHVLQGSMCWAFRVIILCPLVITTGYSSYCFLSVISKPVCLFFSDLRYQQGRVGQ